MKKWIVLIALLMIGSAVMSQNYKIGDFSWYDTKAKSTSYGDWKLDYTATTLDVKFHGTTTYSFTSAGKVTTDSVAVKRVVATDTTQGIVLYAADGTRFRLRVSPSGVLTAVEVP